ncbi:MAG: YggS family pyridoxal phosphate-dependent enzyme [Victivallaceae bacterium]
MDRELAANYRRVKEAVAAASTAASRRPDEVRLLAVSKTFPAADIAELYALGCRAFGESRVPELEAKAAALPADIEWHLIGQLQSNKVRRAVKVAAVIHSVDSVSLLERIDRIAGEEGKQPAILLEVNISGEASKSGLPPEELESAARFAAALDHLEFRGLMTIAPADADEGELHRIFGELRRRRDELSRSLGIELPELSMGMSGDYAIAIAEGATLVRIGSSIFGRR